MSTEKNPHNKNLLVELLVEELPPKALKKLGEAFGNVIFDSLKKLNQLEDSSKLTTFASPRRLAAHITQVLPIAAAKPQKIKIMPVSVAFDANKQPTPALLKKLQSLQLDYILNLDSVWDERITIENDGKSDVLFHTDTAAGLPLQLNLQFALQDALDNLPIPKVMTYQLADGWSTVNFVRPAHGLVALHGSEIVPITALGLASGNTTQGHRFEAAKPIITLKNADSYAEQLLNEGAVIANYEERSKNIISQLITKARELGCWLEVEPKHTEGHPIQAPLGYAETEELLYSNQPNNQLIHEVTALVERPNVLLGQFEEIYLEVPQECLILTMKANQKYFPLLDSNGKLTNKFLIVSNISPADPSAVIQGNERVVRPRLADAKFFFDQDRKKTLESRIAGLDKVVYHNKLGSQGERTERVRAIAKAIGQQLGGDTLAAQADQAAMLAKADLVTDMVGEFPELQGIMGRYYAQHEKLDDEVAFAIEDHYKPRFAGDELPRNQVAICVALADKLETLVGLFSIGEKPTGDKDPFGLRRHALGILRILIENELPLNLSSLCTSAALSFAQNSNETMQLIHTFIHDRLASLMLERGYSVLEVDSVVSQAPERIDLVPKRLEAVRAFSLLPEAPALAAANKRIRNILKKAPPTDGSAIDPSTPWENPEEAALFNALNKHAPVIHSHFANLAYTEALIELAKFKIPVDNFFDKVMVMTDNPAQRNSRLDLLRTLDGFMNQVADISKLAS